MAFSHFRVMDVEAIDELDLKAASPQVGGKIEQAKGLGPEVVGREVVDPGVDEDERGIHERAFGKAACLWIWSQGYTISPEMAIFKAQKEFDCAFREDHPGGGPSDIL